MRSAMPPANASRLRIFVDADVLFAGAAAPSQHGASLVVLRLAEITLIEAVTSQQIIAEAERNLAEKLPAALPAFRLIASRCLRIVPDPEPADLAFFASLADPKDLPILATAVREGCPWLVTFNVRHFQPGHPALRVLPPGEMILRVRERLAGLGVGPAG
jgi:predicted nucleic acid-binding protein